MIWLIEPIDPLIARDGRPFSTTPGSRARSLDFPFPSTTAGAARTRAGQDPNGYFNPASADDVANIPVRGPLLAELTNDGAINYFAPAPGDALLFDEPDGRLSVQRLTPLIMPDGAKTDLVDDLKESLHVVGLVDPNLNKPARRPPAFWRWDQFAEWLINPAEKNLAANELGITGPDRDRRSHVSIDPATLTGRDGMLFATSGLSFWHNETSDIPRLSKARRLALVVDVDSPEEATIAPGYGSMGGERRLMYWHQAEDAGFPAPPKSLRKKVMDDGYCRVVLLTPACFTDGWRPADLLVSREGITPELKAAITGKPRTVSGWNLKAGRPRPSRRLVPAGSVYYLKLSGNREANGRWFDAVWMQCVSDAAGDKAAGFGLAAVGAWSGVAEMMNLEETQDA